VPTHYHSPMLRRLRALRTTWVLVAAFQLLLATAWSVTDARADAESMRDAVAHVEATGTKGCPSVHPVDCIVCRALSTPTATSAPVAMATSITRLVESVGADAERLAPSAREPGDPPQRAPPVLS
jgi:citrate lyase beta subunit